MKRSITILSRVRRQLSSLTASEFPAEHRGRAVQAHNADAEYQVKCFEHF
jgi:hypothetical protein